MKRWYAVQRYIGDTEWGTGSYDYDEDVEMLKNFVNNYGDNPEEMMIAVIEEPEDGEEGEPMCVEEIRALEIIE